MIQDISPSRLDNAYKDYSIREEDTALFFDREGKILTRTGDGEIGFPDGKDAAGYESVYLFSVDETRFFLWVIRKTDLSTARCGSFAERARETESTPRSRRIISGNGIATTGSAVPAGRSFRTTPARGRFGAPRAETSFIRESIPR